MKRDDREIVCDAPVTEKLLYNINEILIPTLLSSNSRYRPVKIHAEIAPPIDKLPYAKNCRGGVGTGLSCGVDSFHALLKHLNSDYPSQNITHCVVSDIGSFQNGVYVDRGLGVKEKTFERAEKAADELNLPIIKLESNFQHVIRLSNLLFHTYRDVISVFALQKLWRTYYYESGLAFSNFTLERCFSTANAYFDLLLLDCFSISNLRLISAGGEGDRNDKISFIA